jgi:outer membrane receptor protein involved in Fe transport
MAAAEDADNGNVIVVTGRGLDETPATPAYDVVNIPAEQIVATGSGRIEDALSNVAGFQEFRRSDSRSSNPSAQGVTLRALNGNATSRAQVLLDGVPMADPMFGYIPLSSIMPDQIRNIRVTRGGGSGPFGSGALAGTIEMESADAHELGLIHGQALVNDRGETQVSGSLAPELGKGFAVVAGEWDRGQGFWTTPEDQRVPASARARYDSWTAQARVVEPLGSDIELQARGMAFDDNRTLRFVGADSESKGQDLSLRLVGRGEWKFDALAYGQWRNFSNIVISSSTFKKTLDQRDTPSQGYGGKLEVRPPVGPDHVLRLGTDLRESNGDLAEYRFLASGAGNGHRIAGGHNSDLGFFAEDDWTLGPVILTGGVRADRWSIRDGYQLNYNEDGTLTTNPSDNNNAAYPSRSGWEATWRAGALATVAPGVRLRAAAYTGLRLPTVNELYRPFVVFPVTTQANPGLENERLEGYEAGIELVPAEWANFSLTAFDNKLKNAISNVTVATNLKQRQNVDAIHAQGIEFQGALRSGAFSLTGSLAYTDSKVEASGTQAALDGLRPAQTPKWSTSATLAWEPKDRMRFAATLRHTGAAFEDDLNSDVLPAATTLDLFAQVPVWKELSVVLRGENVFDATIVTRNQGGSMDYGTPATVWAGLRWGY